MACAGQPHLLKEVRFGVRLESRGRADGLDVGGARRVEGPGSLGAALSGELFLGETGFGKSQ